MCLGAISWSGVRRLVCGSRNEDAHAIGVDEGPKPPGRINELERCGISVVRAELRDERPLPCSGATPRRAVLSTTAARAVRPKPEAPSGNS